MEEKKVKEEQISELFKLSDIKAGLRHLKGFGNVLLKSAIDVADSLLTTFRTFFTIRTSKVAKLLHDYAGRSNERSKSIQASLRGLESDNIDFLIFAPQAFLASKIGQLTWGIIGKRQAKLAASGQKPGEGEGLLSRLNKLFFITSSRHYFNNLLTEALLHEDSIEDFKLGLESLEITLPPPKEELQRLLNILESAEQFVLSRKEALEKLDETSSLDELAKELEPKPELKSAVTALQNDPAVKSKSSEVQLELIQFPKIREEVKAEWATAKKELKSLLEDIMPKEAALKAVAPPLEKIATEVIEKYKNLKDEL